MNPRNLPIIYPVVNVAVNETPSGNEIISRNEFLFIDSSSVKLFMGENSSYNATIKMRKLNTSFSVFKCDTVLFGGCITPQAIPKSNYTEDGDWVIINAKTFSGYGLVDSRPDLEPIDIEFNPENPIEGDITNITATIENKGLSSANNSKIELLVDNKSIGIKTCNISANSQAKVNFTWNAIRGNHNLTIKVDPSKELNESDNTNNEISVEITVFDCTTNSTCSTNQICNITTNACQNLSCSGGYQPQNHICVLNIRPGDSNGDGAVNIFDVIWAEKIAVGLQGPPVGNADANCDGAVNIFDVIWIEKIAVGLPGKC